MTSKTRSTIYWIVTGIFGIAMIADGFGGVTRAQAGIDVLVHLGYPVYLLTIVGIAKIIGGLAILQPVWRTVKEWAYAGFVINCLGAFGSRYFIGDTGIDLFFPIIFLGITIGSYVVWKKYGK